MDADNRRSCTPRQPKLEPLARCGVLQNGSATPRASSACGFATPRVSSACGFVSQRPGTSCGFAAPGSVRSSSSQQRPPPVPRPASTPLDEDTEHFILDKEGRYRARPERRMYPNSPATQSFVDTVVFGRDMDLSGDSKFDDEYVDLFRGSAGRASWAEQAKGRAHNPEASSSTWGSPMDGKTKPHGLRHYPNAPVSCSVVDQVVFGRDLDNSGDNAFAQEDYVLMHKGAAGVACGTERPRGLANTFRNRRVRQARLQDQARDFVGRLQRGKHFETGAVPVYAPKTESSHQRKQRPAWCSTVKSIRYMHA